VQDLYNDQNTIGDLGNALVREIRALSKMLTGVVGQIVFAMFVLVGVIFLGIVIYVIIKIVRGVIAKNNEKTKRLEANSMHVKTFEKY